MRLSKVEADIRDFARGNVLTTAVVVLYLLTKIGGLQSGECIVVSQERVDLWGKGGIHYSIPWRDRPTVIGQRNNRKSLLTYYQTTPGALDRLAAPEAREEAMTALGWCKR